MHANGASYERMYSMGSGTYANVSTQPSSHVHFTAKVSITGTEHFNFLALSVGVTRIKQRVNQTLSS